MTIKDKEKFLFFTILSLSFLCLLFSCSPGKKYHNITIKFTRYREIGQTSVYRAGLSHIPLKKVTTIAVQDSSGGEGSDGIYSGFDIDFLLLDSDGDLYTKDDQIYPLENRKTKISPGKVRNPEITFFTPTEDRPGSLFGLDAGNKIDFDLATISLPDASYDNIFEPDTCSGWLSLGDRGALSVHFGLKKADTFPSLFLFIGEAGPGFEEHLNADISIIE